MAESREFKACRCTISSVRATSISLHSTTSSVLSIVMMDEASALLILQLQIEDSQELLDTLEGKGKNREGELSDAQYALQLYSGDLKHSSTLVTDRLMTKSIAQACQSDGTLLIEIISQDHDCVGDRETALKLSGMAPSVPVEPWTVSSEFLDEELLEKLSALYVVPPAEISNPSNQPVNATDEDANFGPETSNWAATRASKPRRINCVICLEDVEFYDVARVPCGHEYCRACLRELFRTAMQDESLFPPRCCKQPIAPTKVRIFLTSELVRQYEAKKIEHDTRDRTYCSGCSLFLPVEQATQERVTCPECEEVTCTMCKRTAHLGDCPSDSTLQEVLALAAENGWRRCDGCKVVVELTMGCNHIT
jgi:hypothetical protein